MNCETLMLEQENLMLEVEKIKEMQDKYSSVDYLFRAFQKILDALDQQADDIRRQIEGGDVFEF